MAKDFLPSKDADLLAWSVNWSARITSTPTAYGLTAAMATAYSTLHDSFASLLSRATEPSTRTRGAVAAKNDARRLLKAQARDLARIVNAFPAITNEQRLDLGLNPRSGTQTPIQPPTESPVLEVVAANGRILKLKIHSPSSPRRGKPDGVNGSSVFSFVGSAPPADISLWKFEGSTTRTLATVEFPPTVPAGAQVWLTAFFFNPRSQSGPACTPISAYVAGGVVGAPPMAEAA
jgi:hypothetical protein